MSREYAEIIRQTPHVRYRSNALLIVLLVILGIVTAMTAFMWIGIRK